MPDYWTPIDGDVASVLRCRRNPTSVAKENDRFQDSVEKEARSESQPPSASPHVNDSSVFESEPLLVDTAPPPSPVKPGVSPAHDLFTFVIAELTRGYDLGNAETRFIQKQKKVYAFLKIPKELEKFLFYGLLQCFDAFMYIFTFLPIRFFLALLHMICRPFGASPLSSSEVCDIIKVTVLCASSLIIAFVDTSAMYHVVRGQAVIKLYIAYNMLEVADKLFSSFGQDILDSLFWSAMKTRERKRDYVATLVQLFVAVVYVVLHTGLVLFQATTLNVAFNSQNKALMTIMMSNNFVELKGSVFKKFAKNNLFQMSCSDVRERFHYCILLTVVVFRNMGEFNWKLEHLWEMGPDIALVIIGEFFVDWIKHAFITKFNEIPYEVYTDFTITIAYDVVNSHRREAFSDHSDQVARRMGFIPLPLSVLLIRVLPQSMRLNNKAALILLFLWFLVLVSFKVLNSIIVIGWANRYVKHYEDIQKHSEFLNKVKKHRKTRSLPGTPRMSLIEFSDVMQQQHVHPTGLTLSDVLQHVSEDKEKKRRSHPCGSESDWNFWNPHFSPERKSKSIAYPNAPKSADICRTTTGLLNKVHNPSAPHASVSIATSPLISPKEAAGTPSVSSTMGLNPTLPGLTTPNTNKGLLPRSKSVAQLPKTLDSLLKQTPPKPSPSQLQSQKKDRHHRYRDKSIADDDLHELGPLFEKDPKVDGGASGSGSPSAGSNSPATPIDKPGECESLAEVNRFTLCNEDRIVM